MDQVGDARADGRFLLQHVDAGAVGDDLDVDLVGAADVVLRVLRVVQHHVPARGVVVGHLDDEAVLLRGRGLRVGDVQGGGEGDEGGGEEEGAARGHGGSGSEWTGS